MVGVLLLLEAVFTVVIIPILLFILGELGQIKKSNRELAERVARLEGKLEILLDSVKRNGGGRK